MTWQDVAGLQCGTEDFSEPGGGFDTDAQRKGGTTGRPPDFWLMVLG